MRFLDIPTSTCFLQFLLQRKRPQIAINAPAVKKRLEKWSHNTHKTNHTSSQNTCTATNASCISPLPSPPPHFELAQKGDVTPERQSIIPVVIDSLWHQQVTIKGNSKQMEGCDSISMCSDHICHWKRTWLHGNLPTFALCKRGNIYGCGSKIAVQNETLVNGKVD